jgi:fructose-bisphosphate aldolase, class II
MQGKSSGEKMQKRKRPLSPYLREFSMAGQASKIKKVITVADMAKRYAKGELAQKFA